MIDSRKLLLFVIGILLGAAIGAGTYAALTGQEAADCTQYEAQIGELEDAVEEKEARIAQLEQDQQALQQEIADLREQIERLSQQLEAQQEEAQGPTDITIFHINDLHGRAQSQEPQDGMVGGLAKIAYLVNQEREAGANVLFLDAGDSIYGTILTNYYEGIPTVEALNAADLDAMCVGNHEFDFGLEPMITACTASEYPWLAATITETATGIYPEYLHPYVIKEVGDVDVAILGLFDDQGLFDAQPQNVEGLEFQYSTTAANALLPQLDEDSDLVIALTHIGYGNDVALAESTDGIDIIVGGHSHTRLDTPDYVDETIIVQAWNHGLVLGRLDVTVENDVVTGYTGRLIPITSDVPDDPGVSAALQPYVDEYGPIMNEVVGTSLVDLDAETEALQGRDTNAGNLVADAMLWQAQTADIALHNSGGFRWKRVFPAGDITRADVHELLPFQNSLVVADFTGGQIMQELEYYADGGWLQVAGMRFTYDPSLPVGERVTEVYVGGQPLDPEETYTVAMGSFIAEGGSGHWVLTTGQNYGDLGITLADSVINYLQEFSPVSPTADGRITRIE
jgi:5'-nucleotidase/UDP-sugar diphosphatase